VFFTLASWRSFLATFFLRPLNHVATSTQIYRARSPAHQFFLKVPQCEALVAAQL